MPKPKINLIEMNKLLTAGKSQKEIAEVFGVSSVAVHKAKKKLSSAVVKNLALEAGARVLEKNLNVVDQLYKINQDTLEILNGLMGKIKEGTPSEGIAIKAIQEIRNQLSFQVEILKTLYDLKSISTFQETVISTISEVEPEVAKRIVSRLKEAKALRGSVSVEIR